MTLTSTTIKNRHSADGTITTFPYTFRILDQGDIKVQVEDSAGTITTKTITTDYTVSGVTNTGGGNVTFVTAPLSTDTVILTRNTAKSQTTSYTEADPFDAEAHELALDKLAMIAQQLEEEVSRSATLDESSSITNLTLPVTANGYLVWNSGETALQTVVLSDTGLLNFVEDTTPQLGGDLDAAGYDIQFDDATGIDDDSGNEHIIFQETASAVNHLEITNAAAGNAPSLAAAGGDTNIDLKLTPKGSGTVPLGSNNLKIDSGGSIIDGNRNELLEFAQVASAVNEFTITNAASGDEPIISVTGDDTNIDINIQPKGTGALGILGTSSDSGTIRLYEDTDNGTSGISFDAPASVTTSTKLVFPAATGAADEILTTNASGTLSWTAGPVQTWILLASATASTSSSIDFTSNINSTYDLYAFVMYDVVPATDGAVLVSRVSDDGGSTWESTNYLATGQSGDSGSSSSIWSGTTYIPVGSTAASWGIDAGNTAGGLAAIAYLGDPSNTSNNKHLFGQMVCFDNDGSTANMARWGGFWTGDTTAITGVRFLMSSGNIASGEFRMYGIKTS